MAQMSNIDHHHNHTCLFYNGDPSTLSSVIHPFVRSGLALGERCVYVADDQEPEDVGRTLRSRGIDVRQESRRQALLLWSRRQWRQPGGLDSRKKERQVRGLISDALKAGFEGVRIAVEMTWTLTPDIEAERLKRWEATLDSILKSEPAGHVLCLYNSRRLSADVILAGLQTHPTVIVDGVVHLNPFYKGPTPDKQPATIREMLVHESLRMQDLRDQLEALSSWKTLTKGLERIEKARTLIQAKTLAKVLRRAAAAATEKTWSVSDRLYPEVLRQFGLAAALTELSALPWGPSVQCTTGKLGPERFPSLTEITIYRIAEAVLIDLHESRIGSISIILSKTTRNVDLVLRLPERASSLEETLLETIRDRVKMLGGFFQIESRGNQDSLLVRIPCRRS